MCCCFTSSTWPNIIIYNIQQKLNFFLCGFIDKLHQILLYEKWMQARLPSVLNFIIGAFIGFFRFKQFPILINFVFNDSTDLLDLMR